MHAPFINHDFIALFQGTFQAGSMGYGETHTVLNSVSAVVFVISLDPQGYFH